MSDDWVAPFAGSAVPGDQLLDVSGLNCPLPVLKARRRMRTLGPGQILEVRATDPMARIDIPHFCNTSNFTLLSLETAGETLVFRILKPA